MYLLNGELVDNTNAFTEIPNEPIGLGYIHDISFNRFDPPVGDKQLTWLKSCRLHDVSLSRQGISTKGHLWKICNIMHTREWPKPPRWSRKRTANGLNDFQRDCLNQLAGELWHANGGYQPLAFKLWQYLDEDEHTQAHLVSPTKEYTDLMAETVVEAIRVGDPLQIASTNGSTQASGIFVGLPSTAFTSWHAGSEAIGRERRSHVSLEVKVEAAAKGAQLLRITNWVNGLVFFSQRERVEVVFGWPSAWLDRVMKRKLEETSDSN